MTENETVALDDGLALDLRAAPDTREFEAVETPEAFLAGVSKALKESVNVDADLAGIISDHLLTVTPHANAVANAKTAIIALAAERSAPAEEQADG